MTTAQDLINLYDLRPLAVEGGLFARTYLSEEVIATGALPARYEIAHPFGTAILVLFTDAPDSFSALHKLPTDEIYHFYLGDPIELTLLHPDGRAECVVLGQDVLRGQRVQQVVRRDTWQGSRLLPGGAYALFGTTLAPGYHHTDYAGGDRDTLILEYPAAAEAIRRLTRAGAPLQVDRPQEVLEKMSDISSGAAPQMSDI